MAYLFFYLFNKEDEKERNRISWIISFVNNYSKHPTYSIVSSYCFDLFQIQTPTNFLIFNFFVSLFIILSIISGPFASPIYFLLLPGYLVSIYPIQPSTTIPLNINNATCVCSTSNFILAFSRLLGTYLQNSKVCAYVYNYQYLYFIGSV